MAIHNGKSLSAKGQIKKKWPFIGLDRKSEQPNSFRPALLEWPKSYYMMKKVVKHENGPLA